MVGISQTYNDGYTLNIKGKEKQCMAKKIINTIKK